MKALDGKAQWGECGGRCGQSSRGNAAALGAERQGRAESPGRFGGVLGRHDFEGFDEAAAALRGWEEVYNRFRFSMALHGKTPAEKLAAVLPAG